MDSTSDDPFELCYLVRLQDHGQDPRVAHLRILRGHRPHFDVESDSEGDELLDFFDS